MAEIPKPATLKDCTRFFLPLILQVELLYISHSVIHAFLARMPSPRSSLAAFSVALSLQSTVGSVIWAGMPLAISYTTDRRSLWGMFAFFLLLCVPTSAVLLVVAFTPAGVLLFRGLQGASAEVAHQAQLSTAVLIAIFPLVVFRNLASALIMINRRNVLIMWGTLLRMASLAVSLVVLPLVMSGAVVGAVALDLCILVETAFVMLMAWPFAVQLPQATGTPAPPGEMWRFVWPLMLSQIAEQGLAVMVNIFLGRLRNPDLALASFGVVYGLVKLILSPVRNLAQTAQTLARTREDLQVLLRFAARVVLGFAALVLVLFYTPVRGFVLDTVMGLTPELSGYSAPALMLTLLLVAAWGYAEVFRGLLSAVRRTRPIAWSSVLRLVVVALFGGVTFAWAEANGAVVGIAAMTAALLTEALLLGWNVLSRHPSGAGALFVPAVPVAQSGSDRAPGR
jgi:Na+-driven multidrug efflux pump